MENEKESMSFSTSKDGDLFVGYDKEANGAMIEICKHMGLPSYPKGGCVSVIYPRGLYPKVFRENGKTIVVVSTIEKLPCEIINEMIEIDNQIKEKENN